MTHMTYFGPALTATDALEGDIATLVAGLGQLGGSTLPPVTRRQRRTARHRRYQRWAA